MRRKSLYILILICSFPCILLSNSLDFGDGKKGWMLKSIELANLILNISGDYHLYPEWEEVSSEGNEGKVLIPIRIAENPKDHMLYVPFDKKEIIFEPIKLERYLNTYCVEDDLGKMEIEQELIAALLLLHEVGHIENGDNGSFGKLDTSGVDEEVNYNIRETESKNRELAADIFAALQIKQAKDNVHTSFEASKMELAVTFMVWNLSNIRMIENFGSEAAGFWDKSLTHFNLELRFLIIQNELAAPEMKKDSEELIEDFFNRRNNAPRIIYKKE